MKATVSPTSTGAPRSGRPAAVPQPFDFTSLNRAVFGAGSLARLGEFARELGGTRALLVTDPGLEEAGHPPRAEPYLRGGGLEVFVYDAVRENPTTRHVDDGAAFALDRRTDLIVAVGGGSSMDAAKGVNFLLTNGGSMSDYKGFGRAAKP